MERRLLQLEATVAALTKELTALKLSRTPSPPRPVLSSPRRPVLCLFDLETTGLGKTKHIKICEIGAVNYTSGAVFQQYVNPGVPVPDAAVSVHHITNEMLQQKPGWQEIQPEWEARLEKQRPSPDVPLILGGYYSKRYDSRILTFHMNYQYPPNIFFVDFWEIFPIVFDDLQGKKGLGAFHQHVLGRDIPSAHTAVADAQAIVSLCQKIEPEQLDTLIEEKKESAEGVIKRCLK